jgi:hypothetical protein
MKIEVKKKGTFVRVRAMKAYRGVQLHSFSASALDVGE